MKQWLFVIAIILVAGVAGYFLMGSSSEIDQDYCSSIKSIAKAESIPDSSPSIADDVKACSELDLW